MLHGQVFADETILDYLGGSSLQSQDPARERQREIGHRGEGSVAIEAGLGVMQPQLKEHLAFLG
jgi:hypothetical protein